ncbi:MAG: FKBP-type peptidyl-prolyl cis-trans isomerase, partial [Desulfomonile sp.]|nr:FKBP-type peptidyl-prolyl cis-trans isomerase [Desulfomonile sp.]
MTNHNQQDPYIIAGHKSYVKIRYRVQVVDGPVLKGAMEPEIMDFVTGYLHVIPGLEKRLVGRQAGEKLSFTVPPEEAFGIRRPELVIEKAKADFHFPAGVEPYPGMELPIVTGNFDGPETVMIREVRDDTIIIDLNHPLSGLPLAYDLEIIEARPAGASDVCSEWGSAGPEQTACSSIPQIVLGE